MDRSNLTAPLFGASIRAPKIQNPRWNRKDFNFLLLQVSWIRHKDTHLLTAGRFFITSPLSQSLSSQSILLKLLFTDGIGGVYSILHIDPTVTQSPWVSNDSMTKRLILKISKNGDVWLGQNYFKRQTSQFECWRHFSLYSSSCLHIFIFCWYMWPYFRYTYTNDQRFRAIHKLLSEDYLLQILPVKVKVKKNI